MARLTDPASEIAGNTKPATVCLRTASIAFLESSIHSPWAGWDIFIPGRPARPNSTPHTLLVDQSVKLTYTISHSTSLPVKCAWITRSSSRVSTCGDTTCEWIVTFLRPDLWSTWVCKYITFQYLSCCWYCTPYTTSCFWRRPTQNNKILTPCSSKRML